ncbi:protein dispatched homolog 1-like isoform X1 [Haliotis rufescens]|uniref:protein dispatched homolog 1-like isoform X1 n=1 Tax=Haliotis rufescens TaxID=6454 RepID=UPI001EB043A8|nr:protein dispatched homolog 1-like isoform X1 [Haliotis rufescens]
MSHRVYARILAHYPYVVLLVVLVVVATCLVVSIINGETLDFNDPLLGFEPRGTEISERTVAYDNLIDNIGGKASLTPFNYQANDQVLERSRKRKNKKKNRKGKKFGKQTGRDDLDNVTEALIHVEDLPDDKFFCGIPYKEYARVVYKAVDGSNLFTLHHIKAMCKMETQYLSSNSLFTEQCIHVESGKNCCRSWSLGSYIALLSNKSSCHTITEKDVSNVLKLLKSCSNYYINYTMGINCEYSEGAWYTASSYPQEECHGVPSKCTRYNAVYHLFHHLLDVHFIQNVAANSSPHLTYAVTFFPVAGSSLDLYNYMESLPRTFDGVEIVGAKFDLKYKLFQEMLKSDTIWLASAGCVIFLAMWLYSASIFITVMTFLAMFWALTVAYFLYMHVFEIKFFPYMNMVTVVVMIGIGADDVFIYCKVWHLAKAEKNNGTLEKIVNDTLRHATLSMLVTSLTTAASFYANYISDITAIQCFSIYAGTAVICNFFLSLTWIPATIMLYEKWCNFCVCSSHEFYTEENNFCYYLCRVPYKLYYVLTDWSRIFFEKLLPCLVIKFRYVWLVLYGGLGICGVIVIFYYPKLKLPSTRKFQVFSSNHWLEKYDFQLSDSFSFEKMKEEDIPVLPVTIVWGIHASDTGDRLNPNEKGSLVLDSDFDLAEESAQRWLLEFCARFRKSEFYLNSPGLQLTNCFLENFANEYMKRPCTQDEKPCCNETAFPFPKNKFKKCLLRYVPLLQKTPAVRYNKHSPGPRFSNGRISAFMVEFLSNEPYSHSYEKMKQFYLKVNRWVTEEMVQAPAQMRNGWFVTNLKFYDLQNSLAKGTPLALGVSLSFAAIVAFFTTLNVLISFYAIITIACIIIVTVASLVLLGWELNILESVVITVAIGMSVDFTLHYGVAYRLSPDLDREMRVACSIGRMGSAVAMAALTTFLAGVFMMPSTVLVYQKFGTFLMLLITIAWIYSTFFFQSLLRTIGPQGGFGQFHWPASDCCSPSAREHVDKTVYAMSESTLSSSSTSNPNHISSEVHELEPLTEGQETHPRHSHFRHHHPHRIRSKGPYTHMRARSPGGYESKRGTCVTFEPSSETQTSEVIIEQPETHEPVDSGIMSGASQTDASEIKEGSGHWAKSDELL